MDIPLEPWPNTGTGHLTVYDNNNDNKITIISDIIFGMKTK